MRWRRALVAGMAFAGIAFLILILVSPPRSRPVPTEPVAAPAFQDWGTEKESPENPEFNLVLDRAVHPMEQLIERGRQDFSTVRARQSRTLSAAVVEYRRRYGIPPPPNFDKWFAFAQARGVQFIDEYDTIHNSLLPFWALSPATIRERVREALGYGGNAFIALAIRGGAAANIEGGAEWQRNVTLGMLNDFFHLLPDMDIAFNIHDEPRVVVPHDELSQMVKVAKEVAMPAAFRNTGPRKTFSRRPKDMDDGKRLKEYKLTKFNEYAHQATWVPSRMSCPPDSPSRIFSEDLPDNTLSYAYSDLGFIQNVTAFSDICQSPSLKDSFGFFERPNAYKVAHELIPIFSQSKVSSYQDIIYPSPWYWYGKTVTDQPPEKHQPQYDQTLDMEWEEKNATFWWRGTTTGGYARDGGWRRQHRQQFLRKANALDKGKILTNRGSGTELEWRSKDVARETYRPLVDLHFTGVGQCDQPDCDAQREFFEIAPPVNSQDAWKYKYLLDIDGNAFSGRFYAFLRSKSMVFKMAVFREWHAEWLWPWVHYIPLTLKGDDYLEAVRYLIEDKQGADRGAELARESSEWAEKTLRNVDMETWFFRLLLEYGRVIDDSRATIGFDI